MTRRILGLLITLTLGMLLAPLSAAPLRATTARIAFLGFGPPPSASEPTPFVEAFRHGLRERGWLEGHNLTIEWRWTEGNLDQFATLVAEVIRLQVEVIVVPNTATAEIAHQATSTIPIVVVSGANLVRHHLIASPARPGGNVTGVSALGPELRTKHLELLKEMLPGVTRLATLRGLAPYTGVLKAMEGVARALEMELHHFEVRDRTAFDSAFAAMMRAQVHALLVLGDPFLFPYRRRIADLAAQQHLPSVCWSRDYVEAGCLMSYGPGELDRGQRIAAYVDKIVHGAKPADLPVEQPMTFELVINLKTAKALGLTIPPLLLFQATEVIR